VLLNADGRVFFAERMNGTWHMPQGGLEDGEGAGEGCFRELLEETGTDKATVIAEHPEWLSYDVPPEWRPSTWEDRYRGQTQKWFLLRFDGEDDDIVVDTDEPEFRRWRWATVDEVLAEAIEFKRELYPRVFAAFRKWL